MLQQLMDGPNFFCFFYHVESNGCLFFFCFFIFERGGTISVIWWVFLFFFKEMWRVCVSHRGQRLILVWPLRTTCSFCGLCSLGSSHETNHADKIVSRDATWNQLWFYVKKIKIKPPSKIYWFILAYHIQRLWAFIVLYKKRKW